MITPEAREVIHQAEVLASQKKHEYITIEHLFLAILQSERGMRLFQGLGRDARYFSHQIDNYLKENMDELEEESTPRTTLGLSRLLEKTIQHILGSGQKSAGIDDLLAGITEEKDSFACYLLASESIERLDILRTISHPPAPYRAMPGSGENPNEDAKTQTANTSFLDKYTRSLKKAAEKDELDPLIGRAYEVDRMLHILSRRRKNNPLLIGEGGVGKTAIVEGLAHKIELKEVPESLQKLEIYSLNLGALTAGTRYRGDFEERLEGLMQELTENKNAVLFIDEIHTLIGAGAVQGGALDASNLLKPLLSGGQLRCIGSTTQQEFKRVFSKDHALNRRFQSLTVEEPDEKACYEILLGLKKHYEKHHAVDYSNKALSDAVSLSKRYIQDRFLPDKAIDVMDEAGALVALAGKAKQVQPKHMREVVARISRVPLVKNKRDRREQLIDLRKHLARQIFGQEEALDRVSAQILKAFSGLQDPEKPLGAFLFHGPSGVGKTELSKCLADELNLHFLRFDMSEYMEKHSVSRLIGAPPGYVGFEEGGLLTEQIRKNPHALILLDEIEKAHPDIYNLLLQIMDYGKLTDPQGVQVDCRNCLIVLTSNAGSDESLGSPIGFGEGQGSGSLQALKRTFRPEFRGRLSASIDFKPLGKNEMGRILTRRMNQIQSRLGQGGKLELSDDARDWLCQKGYSPELGARPLEQELEQQIVEPLSRLKLEHPKQKHFTIRLSDEHLEIKPA